jgi:hypothetical protein
MYTHPDVAALAGCCATTINKLAFGDGEDLKTGGVGFCRSRF